MQVVKALNKHVFDEFFYCYVAYVVHKIRKKER